MAERTIVTEYYAGRKVVKRTRSADPLRAMQNATAYLATGKFVDEERDLFADSVQIINDTGSRVYWELVVRKNGKLEVTLEYNLRDYVTPGTLHYFRKRNGK